MIGPTSLAVDASPTMSPQMAALAYSVACLKGFVRPIYLTFPDSIQPVQMKSKRAQSDRARAALGYYCTDIDDYILGVRTGRIIDGDFEVTKINAGTGFVQGIELETSYDLTDSLSLFGWASWQDGELENEPISRMMPFSAQAGIRYQFPNETAWLEWLAIGATEQDELSSRDQRDTQRIPLGGTPGYVIGMIRGGWEITPGVTLTCAIENLTAEAYRVHGSGINAPGRNFIFGAEVKS